MKKMMSSASRLAVYLVILLSGISCTLNHDEYNFHLSATIIESKENLGTKETFVVYKNLGKAEGDDGVFGTTDDDVHLYSVIMDGENFDNPGALVKFTSYDNQGEDNIWFTDDDVISTSRQIDKFEDNGVMIISTISEEFHAIGREYYSPYYRGSSYEMSAFLSEVNEEREMTSFEIMRYFQFGEVALGELESFQYGELLDSERSGYFCCWGNESSPKSIFKKTVVDNVTFKYFYARRNFGFHEGGHDVVIDRYTKRIQNESNSESMTVSYYGPGTDGEWATEDDLFNSYYIVKHLEDPLKSEIVHYSGYGPDEIWFTNDDEVASQNTLTFNGNGDIETYTFRTPGQDQIFSSSDDYVSSIRITYNINEAENEYIVLVELVDNLGKENEFIRQTNFAIHNYVEGEIIDPNSSFGGYFTSGYSRGSRVVKRHSSEGVDTEFREEYLLDHDFINLADFEVALMIEKLTGSPEPRTEYSIYNTKEKRILSETKSQEVFRQYRGAKLEDTYTHIRVEKP